MIIKNPYNTIYKYYKVINFVLLLIMVFLFLNFKDVLGFFNDYVSAGYSTPETNFADSYITIYTNIAMIFMIMANAFLYFILMTKKKNSFYHLGSAIYFIVMMVIIWLCYNSMGNIEASRLDPTFANFVRDTIRVGILPIYPLLAIAVIKTTGFNIKTFRFDNNSDLKIRDYEEDEGTEIKFGSDDNSLKRNGTHLIREIKYYVMENKFVFSCIGVVALIAIAGSLYMHFRVYNRSYRLNQAFMADNFVISLKESIISDVNYKGDIITPDKYYLAIKIGLENKGKPTAIDTSVFALNLGNEIIYPNYDKASHFIDIGKIYQGETIRTTESHEYVFVYELNKDQIHNSYQLKILNDIVQKEGEVKTSYRILNVKPKNITKTLNMGTTNTGREINLKETTLGKTTFKLTSAEVTNIFTYTYDACDSKNNCKTIKDNIIPSGGNMLFVITDELKFDETTQYYMNSYKDFYSDFVTLKYTYNTSARNTPFTVTTKLKNVTPQVVKNKKVYEVSGTIGRATNIEMIVKIRNKYVTIKIK